MKHYSFNRYDLLAVLVPGSLVVLTAWRVNVNLFALFGIRGVGLIGVLALLIFGLTAGLILSGVFGQFGRLIQRLSFGPVSGSFFLERASREAGLLKVKLAHSAGHSFDRNFPQTFKSAFHNYFKYETANEGLRDQLCLSALAERSPEVRRRLERLAAGGQFRMNLAGLFLLYTLARVVWIAGGGLSFTALRIVELALAFLIFLGFTWSYLCRVGVYYHELYLAFFALTVAEKVDRPHVRLQTRDDRSHQRRRRRKPGSGGGGDRSSGGGGDRPSGSGNRPSGGGNRPSGGGDRPSGGGGDRPSGSGNRPSGGGGDRPSGGGNRPSGGGDRP